EQLAYGWGTERTAIFATSRSALDNPGHAKGVTRPLSRTSRNDRRTRDGDMFLNDLDRRQDHPVSIVEPTVSMPIWITVVPIIRSRNVAWRSGGTSINRKPPLPAPHSLPPLAPAARAASYKASIWGLLTFDDNFFLVSQPSCSIAPNSANNWSGSSFSM